MKNNKKFIIPYGHLLANAPYCVTGIGTVVSPKLKNLYDKDGENIQYYAFAGIAADNSKGSINGLLACLYGKNADTVNDKFTYIIQNDALREVFAKSLSLFFVNPIKYIPNKKLFAVYSDTLSKQTEGIICKENFDFLCCILRQLMHNYSVSEKTENEDLSNKSDEVAKALNVFKKYSKQQIGNNLKNYQTDNIISKMCVANSGYNLFNIYNLTVWQLYDQFQAYSQNRMSKISERSFSVWGGEDFDYELWLKNNN